MLILLKDLLNHPNLPDELYLEYGEKLKKLSKGM